MEETRKLCQSGSRGPLHLKLCTDAWTKKCSIFFTEDTKGLFNCWMHIALFKALWFPEGRNCVLPFFYPLVVSLELCCKISKFSVPAISPRVFGLWVEGAIIADASVVSLKPSRQLCQTSWVLFICQGLGWMLADLG